MTDIAKMFEAAKAVREKAYAPYSNFKVGVCLQTEDGDTFTGCNIENAAYSNVLHAEAVAIGHMIAAGKNRIKEVVVVGTGDLVCTPCGSCRQMIREFGGPAVTIHSANAHEILLTSTLADLLPHSFGPENLETA